jgi:hypothetical protein
LTRFYAIPVLSFSGFIENLSAGIDSHSAGVGGTMDLWAASSTPLALRALAAGPAATGVAMDHSITGQPF